MKKDFETRGWGSDPSRRRTSAKIGVLTSPATFAACLLLVLFGASCGTDPRVDEPILPPANRSAELVAPARTGVIVANFENPSSSAVPWSTIGAGMSSALARTIAQRPDATVIADPALAAEVRAIVRGGGDTMGSQLRELGARHPGVGIVVLGEVTDFRHTGEKPDGTIEKGFLFPENNAFVSIWFTIVTLPDGVVRARERASGTAPAGGTTASDRYREMEFGSYEFWQTPLGRASKAAIDQAASLVAYRFPEPIAETLVKRDGSSRDLEIAGGEKEGFRTGQRYGLAVKDGFHAAARPVLDTATRLPLVVQIIETSNHRSRGRIIGEAPAAEPGQILVLRGGGM